MIELPENFDKTSSSFSGARIATMVIFVVVDDTKTLKSYFLHEKIANDYCKQQNVKGLYCSFEKEIHTVIFPQNGSNAFIVGDEIDCDTDSQKIRKQALAKLTVEERKVLEV